MTATKTPGLENFADMMRRLDLGEWFFYRMVDGQRIDAGEEHHYEKVKCCECKGSGRVSDYSGRSVRHYDCWQCKGNRYTIELFRNDGIVEDFPQYEEDDYGN